MSDTTGEQYGPRLAAAIDRRRGDTSIRRYAESHGLDPAQISKWRSGATPGLAQIVHVADGIGEPLGQLLIEIGAGTPQAFTVTDGPPLISVAQAIDADPSLRDYEAAMLRDLLASLMRLRQGTESVTIGPKQQGTKSSDSVR